MRKLVIGFAVLGMAAAAGPALAGSPSGSSESGTNVVTCNRTTGQSNGGASVYQAGHGVFVGPNGAEVCSDDNTAIDGRVIVSKDRYVAADGDSSNPTEAQGWARIDAAGPKCGGPTDDPLTSADNDATQGAGGNSANCG